MLSQLFKKQRQQTLLKAEHQIFKRILKRKIPKPGQIKYLGRILTKKEKETIIALFVVILLCLLLIAVNLYFSNSEIVPSSGGEYIEGLTGNPKLINPILGANDVDLALIHLVFSGLLKYDQNLELRPDLVEDFPVDPGQKRHTLCLKENIFWHDGVKLTVDDVIFTFSLIKNPVFKNSVLERLKTAQITKINGNCLEIELKRLSDLTLGILPKHVWGKLNPEKLSQSEFNLKPIGSGPFKFMSLARDKSGQIRFYALEQNKNFYNKIPAIEKITFRFYPDFEQAIEALKVREINGLGYSPKQAKEKLLEIKNLRHYQLNLPYYTAVFLNLRIPKENTNESNLLREKSVRQALAHLTPKKQIFKEVFNQEGIIIHGPTLPSSFAFNPEVKRYDYDPRLAEEILNRAGWQMNSKGFFERGGKTLELTLTTVNQPDFQKTAQLIQKAWQDIGLKVKLILVPPEQIKEIIKTRNFQAFLYGILENFNLDPYPLWHSSQINPPGLNLTGFSYRRVDELLEKAILAKDEEDKKIHYLEFQEIIADYLPAIFLYNTTYSYLVDQKIKGIDINRITHPADRFLGIENWYIKTKRQYNN